MASKYAAILTALTSAIAAAHETVDLSGTGAVQLGRFASPPKLPFCAVDCVSIETEDDAAPIGIYEHTATFLIEAWNTTALSSVVFGVASSVVIADDLTTAIHQSHRSTGGALKGQAARRVNVTDTEYLNTEINGKRIGHVRMTVEIVYTTTEGI